MYIYIYIFIYNLCIYNITKYKYNEIKITFLTYKDRGGLVFKVNRIIYMYVYICIYMFVYMYTCFFCFIR